MAAALFPRLTHVPAPVVRLSSTAETARTQFLDKLNSGTYQTESVSCLCGATDELLLAGSDRYALPVQTHLCRTCGLLWTSPRLTFPSLLRFYDEDYRSIYVGSPQADSAFFEEQVQHGNKILSFVRPHLSSTERRIFDVGCGAGGVLLPFRDVGMSCFGCDYGSQYLEYGRGHGLTLEQGPVEALARYGPADLVVLSHVLEHAMDPREMLAGIRANLSPQGLLYIELPGVYAIHRSYGDFLRFLQNAHLYHFTLATLKRLLSHCGFEYVAGDEIIHALFRRSETVQPIQADPTESQRILGYLRRIEPMAVRQGLRLYQKARRAALLARQAYRKFAGPAVKAAPSVKAAAAAATTSSRIRQ